tara:strand:+ start:410 stop:631 length:222 start_codon:yes stop_codon:yes gene_type:complete
MKEQLNMKEKVGKIFKHLKSGGLYKVLSTEAHLEKEGLNGDLYVVYSNLDDGLVWVREQKQFFDGRFEEQADS